MANSLRAKLSKLRHDGNITDAEYQDLIKKLDGHDREIYGLGYNQGSIDRAEELQKCREYGYNKAIDEFSEAVKNSPNANIWSCKDIMLEFCDGDNCEGCMEQFREQIDEIAEQLKGGAE